VSAPKAQDSEAKGSSGQNNAESVSGTSGVVPTREHCSRSGVVAKQMVADGATLLDVRTDQEWNEGHLDGARHIPVDEVSGRIDEIPKDKSVVTYCRSGGRASRAAQTLQAAGYDVYVLGGMSDWDQPGQCSAAAE